MILTLSVAVILFWLAFDSGTYGLESRSSLAVGVWWVLIVGVGLGLLPRARPTTPSLIVTGLLAALAALTLASMTWAPSAENAFTEFNRVTLYLGVFVLIIAITSRADTSRVADGIALGVGAIAAVALGSRFFPVIFPEGSLADFLPAAQTRLSYPLNYWNALAIFVALGVPLLLRVASIANRLAIRGLAVGPLPMLVAVMYLASSRGGFAVAIIATTIFLALTPRRWAAAGAVAVALATSVATVAVLVASPELVNGPLESSEARTQGWQAALLITLISAGGGVMYAFGVRYAPRVIRPGPVTGRLVASSVIVLALAGIAATNPLDRIETFKQPPPELTETETDFVKAHLLSGNGSGRWQFWNAAVDEFERSPAFGEGAGSYGAWWLEHRPISLFARDAHSLYLEVLAELGVVGLLLVAGVVVTGIVTAAQRLRGAERDERVTLAALGAAFGAWVVGVGIDWMWELTVVALVGVALLGLLTGPATAVVSTQRQMRNGSMSTRGRAPSRLWLTAGIGLLLAAWLVVCAQAIPLLSDMKLSHSEAAIRRGDVQAALSDAHAAQALKPWAASPYLQLALVQEQVGALGVARDSIRKAVARDSRDWRLWLVAARLETKLGLIVEARTSLEKAVALNPRSPLFSGLERAR